jgi:hypothetical protein
MEYGARVDDSGENGQGQLVADQIATELAARGFAVVRNHGQSGLKCHVAVKRAGETEFRLWVQVDDLAHYSNTNLIGRYVMTPSILSAFGWNVMTVLGKDWRNDPGQVIEQIVARC